MMKRLQFFTALFAACMLWGCAPDAVLPAEYGTWVENPEHGLRITKQVKEHRFELQYRPADYIALSEMKKHPHWTQDEFAERQGALENLQHFTLRVHCPPGNDLLQGNLRDEQEYFQRMDYYQNFMSEDLSLVDGADTLSPAVFHFEQVSGLGGMHTFVLAFEEGQEPNSNDKTLIWNARTLGYGPVHLMVKGSDLAAVPSINI